MNEQDDKVFHDWVRQSLDSYRPPYDPQDWAQLQRILRRKRWWRRGILASVGLLLLSSLSWFLLPKSVTNRTTFYTKKPDSRKSVNGEKFLIGITKPGYQPFMVHPSTPKKLVSVQNRPSIHSSLNRNRFVEPVSSLKIKGKIRLLTSSLTEQIRQVEPVAFSPEEAAITEQIITGNFGSDSTTYRVIARNLRQWSDAVLVCDLTTSMYPYATQLVSLLKRYAANSSVQGMVFFTDCDSLGRQTYPNGLPGQMFISRSATTLLPVLLYAARNTVHNEDNDENDIEALLVAQREFPQAKHLILVADNRSAVKDMPLLGGVKKPVHVVLCGTTSSSTGLAFQTDYGIIASRTNGSLHTLEDDIWPETLTATTTLRVGEHYYRYRSRKKQFKLTPFTHRPRRFLGFMWW